MNYERSIRYAIREWRSELGTENVLVGEECTRRYGPNVTEYLQRHLAGALFPHNTLDVVRIVRTANRHLVPLYPISRGCNWGLGSKLPPCHGCAIVDMSSMNAILEVETGLRYAIVQPGVSQKMLSEYLRKNDVPLMVNVTGAGGETSLVGNALERGVGMMGQRHRDIRGMEIVLGTAEVIKTGFWSYREEQDGFRHHYPEGVGPDLMGLFVQSNLGIVTAMVLDLQPVQDVCLMLAEVAEPRLPEFIDALAWLRARSLLRDRIEIMADDDPRLGGLVERRGSTRKWGIWAALYGCENVIGAQRCLVEETIESFCERLRFWLGEDAVKGGRTDALGARWDLVRGRPSDYSIESMLQRYATAPVRGGDPDQDNEAPGFVCVLPAVALHGPGFKKAVAVADQVSNKLGVRTLMSFSTVSSTAAEGFFRVPFNRKDERAVRLAHHWNEEMHARYLKMGILPLRVNIEQMDGVIQSGDDHLWKTVRAIKEVLDPNQVIAPGRYSPVTGM